MGKGIDKPGAFLQDTRIKKHDKHQSSCTDLCVTAATLHERIMCCTRLPFLLPSGCTLHMLLETHLVQTHPRKCQKLLVPPGQDILTCAIQFRSKTNGPVPGNLKRILFSICLLIECRTYRCAADTCDRGRSGHSIVGTPKMGIPWSS